MSDIKRAVYLFAACAVAFDAPICVHAQQTGDQDEIGEVVVTARKREETLKDVPVIATALPRAELENLQVTDMTDLPKLVPGLNFGHALLSIGTQVSIRGVGTITQDPGVEQSVGLVIDGASLAGGLAYSSGMFDLGQIEVLKGPQSLFYGKSSTAGVISIRTADPTDQTEIIARAAYEAESITPRAEMILSGPVTDTLKLRLAGMYQHTDGYFKNEATALPGTGGLDPPHPDAPWGENYIVRGTALWDPTSQFTARLKVNMVHDESVDGDGFQLSSCPEGTTPPAGVPLPFIGGGENCQLDRTVRVVSLDPAAFPGIPNNGVPYVSTYQTFGTLDLNYQFSKELSLSSTTGYYHLHSSSLANASESTYAAPFISAENNFTRSLLTEELRLNSNYSGPLNYTVGAYYEDGSIHQDIVIRGNTVLGLGSVLQHGQLPVDMRTYSAFGQLRWKILSNLELAAGARWTDEKRSESPFNVLADTPTVVPTPDLHSKNVAPEVTLTYEPTDDVTLFSAWKKGYKSGSFSIATPALQGVSNSFNDEKVEGGEFGIKTRLLDHRLSVNLAPYYYKFEGLQVGARTPPIDGLSHVLTVNAASAKTYGVDFDAAYLPASVRHLQLNAGVQFNRAYYVDFTNAPCYGGQLISGGCNQLFDAVNGVYTAQDLSGSPLIRAPEWSANAGFEYQLPFADGYTAIFTNNNQVSSRYVTAAAADRPNQDNYQGSYVKVDFGVTVQFPKDTWELALIGKNLNDRVTTGTCNVSNYAGGAILVNPSGGTVRGPAGFDEVGCFADPGREVWFRVTFRH